MDASLTGMGAVWNSKVYACPIIHTVKEHLTIVYYEMLNVLIAVRVWAPDLYRSKVIVHCDNNAVVQVITTGKTKDQFLATCIRSIWLLMAQNHIHLKVTHIEGICNSKADFLSRLYSDKSGDSHLQSWALSCEWFKVPVSYFFPDLGL